MRIVLRGLFRTPSFEKSLYFYNYNSILRFVLCLQILRVQVVNISDNNENSNVLSVKDSHQLSTYDGLVRIMIQ